MVSKTLFVCRLTPDQITRLHKILDTKGWEFGEAPHAHWRARSDKINVVAYHSGKFTVQGKNTPDFVQFILEPEILHEARFGYEDVLAETEKPEMFQPHAGIDESGKGDFFGPLVVACCYVDGNMARECLRLGVDDSKRIRSDKKIAELADKIRTVTGGRFSIVPIGPEAYNRLYESFGNLNRLLAWGHARALENLLEKEPACPRAIVDQFCRKDVVLRALKERGRSIQIEQRPRAEEDVAVAAASILARAEFVRRLDLLTASAGVTLPKGAGPKITAVAADLVRRRGPDVLRGLAKVHFKTSRQAIDAAAGSTTSQQ